LPQFRANSDAHLCFLSGLAELCRNATRAALDADPARPHIDFAVDVSASLVATVTIFNPVTGNDLGQSKSVELLSELFGHFNKVVELFPAERIGTYAYGRGSCSYASSRFVYSPMKLRFATVRSTQ
jgi:hypothetical protein